MLVVTSYSTFAANRKGTKTMPYIDTNKHDLNDPRALVSIKHYLQGARCGQYKQPYSENPYAPDSWEAF